MPGNTNISCREGRFQNQLFHGCSLVFFVVALASILVSAFALWKEFQDAVLILDIAVLPNHIHRGIRAVVLQACLQNFKVVAVSLARLCDGGGQFSFAVQHVKNPPVAVLQRALVFRCG